jgi:uncharacterized membrane protein YjdF
MGLGKTLASELGNWGVLAIVLVLLMIIINQIGSSTTFATIPTVNATIYSFRDSFITGLSEPKNWVAIFVIALVGFGIIKYMKSKKD